MNDAEIKLQVKINDTSANNSINSLDKKGSSLGTTFANAGKTLGKAVVAGASIATTAMIGLISYGVKYNATIEQLETSFEVMLGSAEDATDLIAKLKKVGAETPYELTGLAETTQLLIQYGMTADEAYDSVLSLGDIAQGSADKMGSIALALGQMSSYGKVTLVDIKQMITAGFNPLQEISETTGESMQSLYDRISDGTLAVDEITASIKRSSSEGGKFYKSMEKQSKTLNGQISTLKDNFGSLAGVIAEDTTNAISGSFMPALNEMLSSMEEAFTEDGFDGMAIAFGEGFSNILNSIVDRLPEFVNMGVSMLGAIIDGIQDNLPTIVQAILEVAKSLIYALIDFMPQLLEMGIEIILELAQGIAEEAPNLISQWVDMLLNMIDTILDNLDEFIDAGIELVLALALGLIDAIPKLIEKIPDIIFAIVDKLTDPETIKSIINAGWEIAKALFNAIIGFDWLQLGKDIVNGIIDGMKNVGQAVWDGVKTVGEGIWNGFKNFFGIASPSKLMRDEIGKYLPEGIAVGITANTDSALRSVDEMSQAINDEIGSGLSFANNMGLSGNYQSVTSFGEQTIILENINTMLLDGEKVYDNQQTITTRKNLQTGFGG